MSEPATASPIGVFDSGVGGLSVLREIHRELPAENLLYVADSGHAPYGDKPIGWIQSRSLAITAFLQQQGAKAIVVACNTATGAAAQLLREQFDLPIIAMEPALKPAASATRSGVVGILATSRTLKSSKFHSLLGRFGNGVSVLTQPCPGLVEQVEAGALDGADTRSLLSDYLVPLLEQGADTIVLGCTHYPHLRPLIKEIAGPNVTVMDSGAAVARQVKHRLHLASLLTTPNEAHRGGLQCFANGDHFRIAATIVQLWGAEIPVEPMPQRLFRRHQSL